MATSAHSKKPTSTGYAHTHTHTHINVLRAKQQRLKLFLECF